MADAPLPNDPSLRTPDGTIKDQTTETSTPPATGTTPPPAQTDPSLPADQSLINQPPAQLPPAGAPEKYEAFTLPDGVTIDEKILGEAQAIFKSANLPQATAQSLIDFHTKQIQAVADAGYSAAMEMRKGWRDTITADPELGNRLPEVRTVVHRAIDSLGDPKLSADFRAAMDITGAGDHPAFVKAFYRLAQRIGEGTAVTSTTPSAAASTAPGAGPRSPAQAIYPELPSTG